jgi:hypothetical protein
LGHRISSRSRRPSDCRRPSPLLPATLPADVELAIERSKVRPGDDRYRQLFDLARRLRALPTFKPSGPLLQWIAREWNSRGCHRADGRWLDQLPGQLALALRRVKQPKGAGFAGLVAQAKRLSPPACAARYADKPEQVLLVKLCLVLDRHAGGEPWPLSVRLAQQAVGTSRGDAHRMLQELERDGVIILASKGRQGPASRQASTWRFAASGVAVS